jgi:hypothetical protein
MALGIQMKAIAEWTADGGICRALGRNLREE